MNQFNVFGPFIACIVIAIFAFGCARDKPAVEYFEKPYVSPYHFPLISPGTKFAALPPAVQLTVRAETGSAEIDDVLRDTSSGLAVYRIYFVNYDAFPPMYVAPDGSILNPDLTMAMGASRETVNALAGGPTAGVTLGDLPPVVVNEIHRRAPDAEVDHVTKQTRGDQIVYVVWFKNHAHADLEITAEGTVLTEGRPESGENPIYIPRRPRTQ